MRVPIPVSARRTAVAMALAVLAVHGAGLAGASAARAALPLEDRLHSVRGALVRWDLVTAIWGAERLIEEHPNEPEAWIAAARVAFNESAYAKALERGERAVEVAEPGSDVEREALGLVAYLAERQETWNAFEEHESENFHVRVTPRDRLLVPYALSTLETAAGVLDDVLGWCPPRKVVLEIYPNRRTFIEVSTLTREEVETSGTVAICHFHRLMMISPGALARGYDWLDTLVHEYVHFAVYHLGEDAVPVWMQEGVAKLLEDVWRDEEDRTRPPRLSTLLAEARDAERWVTFEEMHPSMAKLPSASLVSLAFAEVRETVAMLVERGGPELLQQLIAAMRDFGGDLDRALIATIGVGLAELEHDARAHVAGLDLYRIEGASYLDEEGLHPIALEFQDEGETPLDPEVEAQRLEDRKARDWVLIADRLKGRKFFDAAIIEYDKALERVGQADPILLNKKAHALILSGRPGESAPLLERTLRDHPSLSTTFDNLAEVRLRQAGRSEGALEPEEREHLVTALDLLRRSEEINPYNPDTHLRLASILDRLGRTAEAATARERLDLLLEHAR